MFSRANLFSLAAISSFIVLLTYGCQKINEATTLGGDLIPAVDNVNTFDTTISVQTYNGLFSILDDSTMLSRTDEHFAGHISNDPLFGTTNATLYLELKPVFPYTFSFGNVDSLLGLDSVVLVMSYTSTFGDSLSPMSFSVKEISQSTDFRYDSNYLIRSNTFALGSTLGSKNGIIPARLSDSVKAFRDTTAKQLRIPLDNSFGMRLMSYDPTIYATDSAFRTQFKGFAIVPSASTENALLGFDLTGANTKLAFYYHYKNGAVTDTSVVDYFSFSSTSAHANLIERDYSGSQLASYQGGTTPDDLVFIENTPGSFATIKIPDLKLFPNRIIHRAELIAEQVYDPSPSSDNIFTAPQRLYLDAYDSIKHDFRAIPYDFILDPTVGPNYTSFGMYGKKTNDGNGNPITIWKLNVTRYVQNYLTRRESLYDLRLYSPYTAFDLYRSDGVSDIARYIAINDQVASGRVRLGGGNHPSQRMRLHIVYSRL